jgi:hypothetical protein
MASTQGAHQVSQIGAMAAGKLLAKAAGGRLWPTLLILVGIVLVRRVAAVHAQKKARVAALPGASG